jgi:hypothetical protein
MAATGFTPIQLYRTATAAAAPTAVNLADGELAINTLDEKLYFKNSAGTVKLLAANITAIANGGTGATTAAAARTGLGATTLGANIFVIANPGAITFPRFNADNTVSSLSAADFRTAIGAGTGGGSVSSVSGTGTVNGISLSGTVTSTGSLTLGGALTGVNLTTQVTGTLPVANGGTGNTTAQAEMNRVAAAVTSGQYLRGNGTNVVMSAIQAADVPTLNQSTTGNAATATVLQTARTIGGVSFNGSANINLPGVNTAGNQNTTGTAANVTGTVAIANGGTGATSLAAAGIATLTGTETLTNKTITGLKETRVAVPASNIDLSAGNYFTRTISGTTTLTYSNVPATGTTASFILELTNGGSATVNWFAGVTWAGGTAPTLTAAGVDVLGFYTYDGGTTWRGFVLATDIKA